MALLQHERADEVPGLARREPRRRRASEPDAPHAWRRRPIELARVGKRQVPGLGLRHAGEGAERLEQRLPAPPFGQAVLDADDSRPRLGQHHLVVAQQRIVRTARRAPPADPAGSGSVSEEIPGGTSSSLARTFLSPADTLTRRRAGESE